MASHPFLSPTPYHILAYGTLLGTDVFQSFIGGVQAYRVLGRAQFSILQQNIFPIYFSMQTVLPVILALTFPGSTHGAQISSTTTTSSWGVSHSPGGFAGILETSNRWSVLAPLATMFFTSLLNLLVVGPGTTKTMHERKAQETKDGKSALESPRSKEMEALNKKFGAYHGVSTLLNMAGLIATISYGFYLASRLE